MDQPSFKIINKDALSAVAELDDNSVDCIVTSPPYWGLRDYGDDDQIGLEETPQEFVAKLIEVFEALRPKLKDTGSLWVNLGDTYAGGGGLGIPNGVHKKDIKKIWNIGENSQEWDDARIEAFPDQTPQSKLRAKMGKSQIGIPERFKIAMIDNGWICRNTIIWHKPAPMPFSGKDRFTVDFEYVYFFTKQQKYYFKQQKEPLSNPYRTNWQSGAPKIAQNKDRNDGDLGERSKDMTFEDRNMRTTWSINSASLKEAHFAVFPRKLVRIPIRATCPAGGLVVDPFSGSATTGIEAFSQGKNYIGFEINPDYVEIAMKRWKNECNQRLEQWF